MSALWSLPADKFPHRPLADLLRMKPGVKKPQPVQLPEITSSPPTSWPLGESFDYVPQGSAEAPVWWTLERGPAGARMDPSTGAIDFTAAQAQTAHFEIVLENDYGAAIQAFDVEFGMDTNETNDTEDANETLEGTSDTSEPPATDGTEGSATSAAADGNEGCGCMLPSRPQLSWLPLVCLLMRRRPRRGHSTSEMTSPSSSPPRHRLMRRS